MIGCRHPRGSNQASHPGQQDRLLEERNKKRPDSHWQRKQK